ncbi:3-isopropylmalate dehydratase [Brevibacterium yomogidense]|uniref:Alpha-IPM isomerase n=1 Tax=Brevibacterium yomogidense TaxID=946573 RepID=A0A1X6X533_9MICO|nr:3-isopropylmalate dehydratase [Brevibacterium yomogidense]SLM94024.1 3-isopropylmalate dehydratase small subunit [Brevibacterium yomogidense]
MAYANALITGRVQAVFGDDFDIDLTIGVENIKGGDLDFLKEQCMQRLDPDFRSRVAPGDILVGGRNFGYGHPHYPPMVALKAWGIQAIVAESFAPGFWRGETHNGFPLIAIPGVSRSAAIGDRIELDWRNASLSFTASGEVLTGEPLNDHQVRVIEAGGAYNLLLNQYALRTAETV